MKRLLYLAYYVKELDWRLLFNLLGYVSESRKTSRFLMLVDVVYSSLKYNISIMEYFQFRFFELNGKQRKEYAGTGYMYEYQKVMNPVGFRKILENKSLFYKKYKKFTLHVTAGLNELEQDSDLVTTLLGNDSGKVVLKYSGGQCGKEVEICEAVQFQQGDLIGYMKKRGYDVAEEFIVQHPVPMELSPSAVNTVRIFTQLDESGDVCCLGARLRISAGAHVDNMAYGNFAASVDEKTGIVNGPGVYSDIRKKDEEIHPITGVKIRGIQLPFWQEAMKMVTSAALLHPENRSVGWDVAVTENGPTLIEGNHNWCKLLWQLPVKKGLKKVLDDHLVKYERLQGEV